MKLIFIRGSPGTGKTPISNILGQILKNSKVIHVDNFKIKSSEKDFLNSLNSAYKKTIKELKTSYKKSFEYIILEELISDKNFYQMLEEFTQKTKVENYWIRLTKPLEKLLLEELNRNRIIKNSKKDFLKFNKDIEAIKITNEYKIRNDDMSKTIEKILYLIS